MRADYQAMRQMIYGDYPSFIHEFGHYLGLDEFELESRGLL